MKIIKDNDCYIQMNDILYLIRNSNFFPMQMYYDIIQKYGDTLPLNEYIKIENEEYKEYIKSCHSVFDFSYLMSKTPYELDEFSDEIIRNSSRICSWLSHNDKKYMKNRNTNIMFRLSVSEEMLNRKYFLSQIKEIKLLKSGNPTIEYPVNNGELSLKKTN